MSRRLNGRVRRIEKTLAVGDCRECGGAGYSAVLVDADSAAANVWGPIGREPWPKALAVVTSSDDAHCPTCGRAPDKVVDLREAA